MKTIKKIAITGVILAGSLALTALPAFAQGSFSQSLCPNNAGNLCNLTVPNLIISIAQLILVIAFLLAFAFLVIGGVKWIMSGGDKAATESAKGTITAAIIGLIIVLVAWALLSFVQTFFGLSNINIQELGNKGTKI